MKFFLFTSKLIIFWIRHSNWERLNLFISCLITVCLYGRVCYYSFTDVFDTIAIDIQNKVSFNIECFKSCLPFPTIPFTISGEQSKEAGYLKIITFNSGDYLNMWVTFDVFTCNRMIKLKSGVNLTVTIRWLIWKLEHLVNTSWLAILSITVYWGNWNISPHAGTLHMTCTVTYYEITLKKCVGGSIVSTVPPSDKSYFL